MIVFSERQSLLLELLSEVSEPITGNELAELLGVSPRTLRYDVSRINGMAKRNMVDAGSDGYRLNRLSYDEITNRNQGLVTEMTSGERILIYLLDHPTTDVYDIMRDCYLSESVVRAAIRDLQTQVARHNLTLSAKGAAVRLEGSELNFRRFLGRLVHQAMDAKLGRQEKIDRYLPDVDLRLIRDIVHEAAPPSALDDIEIDNMVVGLAICLQRSTFPLGDDELPSTEADKEANEFASALLDGLASKFPQLPLTTTDQRYIRTLATLVLDPEFFTGGAQPDSQANNAIISECLDETIDHFNLTVAHEKLYQSIRDHILRSRMRTSTLPYFRNTLQESLRSRSPFLYDAAVWFADRLSRQLDLSFTDDEIGFLAIYMGIYTKHPSDDQTLRAVIVCPRYQALRDWLLAQLVDHFADRLSIVDIVASSGEIDPDSCDLIVTTTNDVDGPLTSVRISAVLSDLDYAAIDRAIISARNATIRTRVARAIGKYLDDNLFFTDVSFTSSREAISFLCEKLRDEGVVNDDFEASVLTREAYSPTAFARRFAVPHAMDFIANHTKIAILIPSSPIPWETADVSLVLMLAIQADDYAEFASFYQPLISLLYDQQQFSAIRRISRFDEFMAFLNSHLPERTDNPQFE